MSDLPWPQQRRYDASGEVEPTDVSRIVYTMVTIEIAVLEDADDEPFTQSEIEDIAHDRSKWTSWRVLNVGQKRKAPMTVRGHQPRATS